MKNTNIFKKYLIEFIASFLMMLIFYAKALGQHTGSNAYFFAGGDNLELWVTQIINLYHQVHAWNFLGIDYFTENGSSDFFVRPNLLIYSPLILAGILFFKLTSPAAAKQFLFFIMFLHGFIGLFFSQLFAKKYLYCNRLSALLFSSLYIFSFANIIYAINIIPFYFIAMLFPLVLYACFSSVEARTYKSILLLSFIYVIVYLSGYLPFSICAIGLSIAFVLAYLVYINPIEKNKLIPSFIKIFLPIIIASIVILPYYLAVLIFNLHSSSPGFSLEATAHDLAILPSDMQGLFYLFFHSQKFTEQIINWGLIPSAILFIYIFGTSTNTLSEFHSKLFKTAFFVYIFSLLISFGVYLRLSDIFYLLVPVLGKMHIYERYLVFTHLFFSIIILISLDNILYKKPKKLINIILTITMIFFLSISCLMYLHFIDLRHKFEIINLFSLSIFLFILLLPNKNIITLIATVLIFTLGVAYFYMGSPPRYPTKDKVIFDNKTDSKNLVNFFKHNSSLSIIKYVDLHTKIHPYIPRNYPWVEQDKLYISNYFGYELHLATDKGYREKFPYYGLVDWNWLRHTGCQFIIFDKDSYQEYKQEINKFTNPQIKLTLSNGDTILKVNDDFLSYPSGYTNLGFNNGYIQVFNNKLAPVITNFKTNNASKMQFDIQTFDKTTRIIYPFWPSHNLHLKVNNQFTRLKLDRDLYYVDLPPGKYLISFYYHNIILTIGLWVMLLYYLAILVVCLIEGFKYLRDF